MSLYTVLILAVLPASPGQLPPTLELHRTHIPASTPAVCQAYATHLADQQRRLNAALVQRLQARVVGTCEPLAPAAPASAPASAPTP